MLGYASIVGEKERGSLALLLSHPLEREEVLIGKFIGLGSVVTLAILIGFGIASLIIWFNTGKMNAVFGIFLIASILFGLAFLSIALLLSTIFKKRSTSMGAAIFIWFFFVMIWGMIIISVASLSGEKLIESEETTSLDIYQNDTFLTSFKVDNSIYSISYSNHTAYMLGKYVYEFNMINQTMDKISLPKGNYFSIFSYDNKIYLAGNKAMEYDMETKEWKTYNISCHDVSYLNGSIFFLTSTGLVKYENGVYKTISLPLICNFMTVGEHQIYLAGDKSIIEYDIENQTFSIYKNEELRSIYDITYGDNFLYILGERSYEFNTKTKDFTPINIEGVSLAYGDELLFVIEKKAKITMNEFPSWYYGSRFFNPVEIYRGLMEINLNEDLHISYPSFFNNYSLFTALLLWIIIPLIVSLYIFRREDI